MSLDIKHRHRTVVETCELYCKINKNRICFQTCQSGVILSYCFEFQVCDALQQSNHMCLQTDGTYLVSIAPKNENCSTPRLTHHYSETCSVFVLSEFEDMIQEQHWKLEDFQKVAL